MQIGALGDIHGAFDTVQDIMARHPDVPLWVQVGDIASNDGEYFTPIRPLYWIKGNNEDFDVVADAARRASAVADAALPAQRRPSSRRPWRVAALGGTFAPSWYHTPGVVAAAVAGPPPGRRLREARKEPRRQAAALRARRDRRLQEPDGIDLFLTHEAPRPFYPAGRRIDAGKTVINEVLTAMRPRLHLFGHHHEFTDSVRQGVRSIGLDVVTKSYLLIDAETFRCERLDT